MSLPATDNFNRANEAPIGGNWTHATGGGTVQLESNRVTSLSSSGAAIYWNADSFADDQYAQATVSNNTSGEMGPAVRIRNGGQFDAYILTLFGSGNAKIYKIINAIPALLSSPDFAYTAGDLIKLEVVGTTLTAYKNGVAQASPATDAALSSGSAGIWATAFNVSLDDWEGGNVGGAAANPPYTPARQLTPIFAQ